MAAQELVKKLAKPGVVLFDGPEPPAEGRWCLMCILVAKKMATDAHARAIKEHTENGDGKILRLPIEVEGTSLEKAVLTGPSPALPHFGFIDLCWSHVAGVEFLTPEQMALRQGAVAGGLQG